MGAFSKLFSRLRITSDPNVGTQTSAVIQADSTNSSLVLAPNGTGALIASIPDGTATGGNARGTNAVDLQVSRYNAVHVASGANSVIGGGANSRATGQYSVVAGGNQGFATGLGSFVGSGFNNSSSGTESAIVGGNSNSNSGGYAFIGGGQTNLATGTHTVISGGSNNTASSNFSTISGGQSNTASTGTHATVVGGQSNTSSGTNSISGGNGNIASGSRSIALGSNNNASGNTSTCFGESNLSSSIYSLALGFYSKSYLYSQLSWASGRLQAIGDAQQSSLTARREATLSTGATTVLSLDGTGTTNLIIPTDSNRMWNVQIDTIAVVTTITGTATGVSVGDAYRETKQLLFKRVGGTSSIVGTVDTTAIKNDSSLATCALTVTAGASQEMALTFTAPTFAGGGSVTMRVVSKIMLVEVAY